ncbi:MAG: ATP synthase F1 subunit delta [Acidimicrobiales bacterium]|nr:ATP synthase F1 subunit delta [Acidimicrobiales bacterium]
MIESLRGYATAVLGRADAGRVAEELSVFARALLGDESLRSALTDQTLPTRTRRAIVDDLLGRADPATVRMVGYAVDRDRPSELPGDVEWLGQRARRSEALAGQADRGATVGEDLEPPATKSAARERLSGFATALFEDLPDRAVIEEAEDELFRFARTVEAEEPLRQALARQELPLAVRQAVVEDLLSGRAQEVSVRLATYAVAAGEGRGLVELLDWLVEQAAAERGLRVADVRTAVPLDDEQRRRLAESLGRLTGREVELRVSVDPSLIGGATVVIGETVIDGSVRHRLEQLRQELTTGAGGPASRQHERGSR